MKMTSKILFVFLILGLLLLGPTSSYAYWRGHAWVGVGWPGPYYYGGYPYPYYDYPYPYYPAGYVVSSTYQPVVVNGVTYYVNNGVYYTYTQYGYQAVAAPAGAPAPAPAAQTAAASVSSDTDDSITVNVPNDKGGYTPVVLKRSGTGFIGPQGEFYSEFPKISQLQTMYGK